MPLLKKEVDNVRKSLALYEEDWKKFGCSIMVDGRTDKRHRALINFLVNSPNCFSRVYGCLKSTQILVKKCVNLLIKCAACWLRECGPNCFSGVCGCLKSTQILVKKMCELIDKVCNVLVKKMWCKLR